MLLAVPANAAEPPKPQVIDLSALLAQLDGTPAKCEPRFKLERFDEPTANGLKAALRACKDAPEFTIEINSGGGELPAEFEMELAMEAYKGKMTCAVDGAAYSAALIFLQACPVRIMTVRSMLMAHEVQASGRGINPVELENWASALRAMNSRQALMVAKRSGKISAKQYLKMISGAHERYFAADEALSLNLIDSIR